MHVERVQGFFRGASRRALATAALCAYLLGLGLAVGRIAIFAAAAVAAVATAALTVSRVRDGAPVAAGTPQKETAKRAATRLRVAAAGLAPTGDGGATAARLRAAAAAVAASAARATKAARRSLANGRRRAAEVAEELPRLLPPAPAAPKSVTGLRGDWRLRQAQALNRRGAAARREGRWRDAAVAHRRALEIYREAADRKREGLSLANLALAEARLDAETAVGTCEAAAALLHEVGDSTAEGQVLTNLGALHHRAGRDDAAHRCWSQALALLDPASPEHARVAERLMLAS